MQSIPIEIKSKKSSKDPRTYRSKIVRLFSWLTNPDNPFKTRMSDYNKMIFDKGHRERGEVIGAVCQTECSIIIIIRMSTCAAKYWGIWMF